ncbi:hypothetical protein PIB30_029350 [Stylosanthes scabra]|uniref:Uncharacterized protein n=1 Tax=Stylosanthes scabra TaxID=79078 RepID=A0ABU6SBH9_9FABA|nr:hypothetical protein [Stylosanthes scabra]
MVEKGGGRILVIAIDEDAAPVSSSSSSTSSHHRFHHPRDLLLQLYDPLHRVALPRRFLEPSSFHRLHNLAIDTAPILVVELRL